MRRIPTFDLDEVLVAALSGSGSDAPPPPSPNPAMAALLDAASALMAERGARDWTMEDVADRAGVGRATAYRRFGGRDDLVRAAVTRDARRFFAAIADSVRAVEPLEEKVVSGFLTGVRLARSSPLGALVRRDPGASMSILTSESLLRAATTALIERYEAIVGGRLPGPARARAELSAEALVRLGLSFVLIPGAITDVDGPAPARSRLAGIIRPLVAGRTSPPA